ncbi:PGN_0703 family putative restriction endonuclease [Massilia aquatica]|uniref:PD-(D/E)XK nuclease-like domain-containing protein n=1 Tax=Massilia aquatica TaxID=2609000 RepID=A0ABX0LYG7_9BURK|nr:hypothetical protein [Massilia aquatica]NHZ39913.1 hypothetical protein [Massilia aquatica]
MQQQHTSLGEQIGNLPDESRRKRRVRFHQGWWRAFVLAETAGPHPLRPGDTVCSMLNNGESSEKNFFGPGTIEAVRETLDEHKNQAGGMIDERRLFNNMLSSQPLLFNFFGPLRKNLPLATHLVQALIPSIDEVTAIRFEYAPEQWIDNSAFDVKLEVTAQGQRGLIGLESKFTEPFSPTIYDTAQYEEIATRCGAFNVPYQAFMTPALNQLFRNQLIAEHEIEQKNVDFRMTGLFCEPGDASAIATGQAFGALLKDGASSFHIITFARFIEALQMLPLTWPQREWSMMLWARYCGQALSAGAYAAGQAG